VVAGFLKKSGFIFAFFWYTAGSCFEKGTELWSLATQESYHVAVISIEPLELASIPSVDRIVEAVKAIL
jgi:hypothetical protein